MNASKVMGSIAEARSLDVFAQLELALEYIDSQGGAAALQEHIMRTDSVESTLQEVVASQGWDADSQLSLALQHISSQGNPEGFKRFLRETAAAENDNAQRHPAR